MTKQEYIMSNKYLCKAFEWLNEEDLKFMQDIVDWKLNPKENILKVKQIMYHMQNWLSLWELRWLVKAFKVLEKLPN